MNNVLDLACIDSTRFRKLRFEFIQIEENSMISIQVFFYEFANQLVVL